MENSKIKKNMSKLLKYCLHLFILSSFLVGCNKPDKLETGAKDAVVSPVDNELTSSLKSEMVISDDGQKFYDIGACMGLASLVFKEEVHLNDDGRKLLISNKLVQLSKNIDFISINKNVTLISTQKCGDYTNPNTQNYNKCIE